MDGVGGTVKNVLFRAVLFGKTVIQIPRDFADYANEKKSKILHAFIFHIKAFLVNLKK